MGNMIVFLNLIFEKVYYEKNQQMTRSMKSFQGEKANSHLYSDHSGPCIKKTLLPLGNHPDFVAS